MIMEKTRQALEAARKLIDSAHKKGLVPSVGTCGDLALCSSDMEKYNKLHEKFKTAFKAGKLEEAKELHEQLKQLDKAIGKTYWPIGNYPTKL